MRPFFPFFPVRWIAFFGLFVVGLVPLDAQGTSKAPGWMTNLARAYPEDTYVAAIGTGDTRRDAENEASAALAKLFKVQVTVDSTLEQRYTDIVQGTQSSSDSTTTLTKTVGVRADGEFQNLKYSDAYVDSKGSYHVVAFLEREPTAQLLKASILADAATIQGLVSRSEASTALLQSFALLDAAVVVARTEGRRLEQLRFLVPSMAQSLEKEADFASLAAKRDALAAKLTYKVAISGDGDDRVAAIAKSTLAAMSLSANPAGLLTLKGSWSTTPVTVNPQFKSIQWVIDLSLLDEQGTAIASVHKEGRENGLTEAAAALVVYRELEKFLKKELVRAVQTALTELVTKS